MRVLGFGLYTLSLRKNSRFSFLNSRATEILQYPLASLASRSAHTSAQVITKELPGQSFALSTMFRHWLSHTPSMSKAELAVLGTKAARRRIDSD